MMLWFDRHRRFRERLSTYLDGELVERAASGLEAHLASCEACAGVLEELRVAVLALRELPQAEAPRSFRLTSADVAPLSPPRAVPGGLRASGGAGLVTTLSVGLRLSAAGFAAALALLLVLDIGGVVGGGREGRETAQTSALAPMISTDRAASESDAAGGTGDEEKRAEESLSTTATGSPTTLPRAPGAESEPTTTPLTGRAAGGVGSGSSGGVGGPAAGGTEATQSGLPATGADAYAVTATPTPPTPTATATPTPSSAVQNREEVPYGTVSGNALTLDSASPGADSDDGLSTLAAAEIALGVLLGASVIGAAGLAFGQRRRR